MSDIKILTDDLAISLDQLKLASKDFSEYTEAFIIETEDTLAEFKSEFIENINKTLNNMQDTKAPEMQKKINGYTTDLESLITIFKDTDTEIGNAITGGEQ